MQPIESIGDVSAEKVCIEIQLLESSIFILFVSIQKRTSISNGKDIFVRLLYMNRPEWIFILFGCIACIIAAATQPALALLLVKLLAVSCSFSV